MANASPPRLALAGEFGVDPNGSATYRIPIPLPPGTAGMQPELALSYNSAAGVGPCGLGWQIEGLGAIVRTGCTFAQDGFAAGLNLQSTDEGTFRYALNGQRLVAVPSKIDALGRPAYRAEIDAGDLVVVTKTDDQTIGPVEWTVFAHDGRRLVFGGSADACVRGPAVGDKPRTAILCWNLSCVMDRHGNQWTVTYTAESGESPSPLEISYTANAVVDVNQRLKAQRRVQFLYEDSGNTSTQYTGGVALRRSRRLQQLIVDLDVTGAFTDAASMDRVSTWSFLYDPSASGRPLLAAVTGPMGDIAFEYPPAPAPLTEFHPLRVSFLTGQTMFLTYPQGSVFLPADLDGDGAVDLIFITAEPIAGKNLMVMGLLNNGAADGNFTAALSVTLPDYWADFAFATVADVDGDGVSELIVGLAAEPSGVGLALNNRLVIFKLRPVAGGAYTLDRLCTQEVVDPHFKVQDEKAQGSLVPVTVAGDGSTALAYVADQGRTVQMWTVSPPSGDPANGGESLALAPLVFQPAPGGGPVQGWPCATQGDGTLLPLDVDGSGRMGFVRAWNNNGKLTLTRLALSAENGRVLEVEVAHTDITTGLDFAGGQVLSGDINGDGLVDLVWVAKTTSAQLTWTPIYNTGTTFLPGTTVTAPGSTLEDLATAFAGLAPSQQEPGWDHTQDTLAPAEIAAELLSPNVNPTWFQNRCSDWLFWEYALADVNGDGCAKLVATARPNVPDTGSTASGNWRGTWHILHIGHTVLEGYYPSTVAYSVFRSDGGQVAHGIRGGMIFGGQRMMLDLHGRGKAGSLYIQPADSQTDWDTTFFYSYTADGPVETISAITNEFGGRTGISYQSLTDPTVYSRATAARGADEGTKAAIEMFLANATSAPARLNAVAALSTRTVDGDSGRDAIGVPKWVVGSVTRDNAATPTRTDYFYSGARVDTTGRGWLGFDTVRHGDANLNLVHETCYAQTFPFTARALCTSVQSGLARPAPPPPPGVPLPVQRITATPMKSVTLFPGCVQVLLAASSEVWFDSAGFQPCEGKDVAYAHGPRGDITKATETVVTFDGSRRPVPGSTLIKSFSFDYALLSLKGGQKLGATSDTEKGAPDWSAWAVAQCTLATQTDALVPEALLVSQGYTYDDQGAIKTVTLGGDARHTLTHTYDVYGNRLTSTDTNNNTVTSVYDNDVHTFIVTASQPGGTVAESFKWDYGLGVKTSHTDANGSVRTYTYETQRHGSGTVLNRRALVETATGPAPDQHNAALVLASWQRPDRCTEIGWAATSDDGKDGVSRTAHYDPWGRLTSLSMETAAGVVQTDCTYDGYDHVIQETVGPPGRVLSTSTRKFDSLGRLAEELVADESGTRHTVIMCDPPNRQRIIRTGLSERRLYATFNNQRLLVERTVGSETTTWAYDAIGRLVAVTDPAGVVTATGYDIFGRVTKRTVLSQPGDAAPMWQEAYHYTDDGPSPTVTRTDGNGVAIRQTLDARGRLTREDDVTNPDKPVTLREWIWGTAPSHANTLDRLEKVVVGSGANANTFSYEYNACGNCTCESMAPGGQPPALLRRTFTVTGAVASVTYPNGAVQSNVFTKEGQLKTVSFQPPNGAAVPVAAYGYAMAPGLVATATLGNGVREVSQISMAGQLLGRTVTGAGGVLVDLALTWDAAGNPSRITDRGAPRNYRYDDPSAPGAPGRLWSADEPGAGTSSYLYANGNRTSMPFASLGSTLSASYHGQQLTRLSASNVSASVAYDANGNMLTLGLPAGGTRNFTWNPDNRLASASNGNWTMTAAYDPMGRRISAAMMTRQDVPSYTWESPFPDYDVLSLTDSSGKPTRSQTVIMITGAHGVIAQWADAEAPAGKITVRAGLSYLHSDHLGSTVLVTGAAGSVLTALTYTPLGAVRSGELLTRRLFAGHVLDMELDLYYCQARYYDPAIGQFIQPDDRAGGPADADDAYHLYAYAANRPLTFVDPTGHNFIENLFDKLGLGFMNGKVMKPIVMFTVSAGLVIAGVAVIVVTGGLAHNVGAGLLGAGIAGFVYAATTLARHEDLSYDAWAVQLGVGAVSGFLTDGAGLAVAQYGMAVRVSVMVVVGSVMSGLGTLATNAAMHKSLADGLAMSFGVGAATGVLAGALGGAAADEVIEESADAFRKMSNPDVFFACVKWRVQDIASRVQLSRVFLTLHLDSVALRTSIKVGATLAIKIGAGAR